MSLIFFLFAGGLLVSNNANAGEPLLTPNTQLTYQVTRTPRGQSQSGPSEYTASCTLAAVEGGPTTFQAMGLQCDRDWTCASIRSERWFGYTDSGLRTFENKPTAQTAASDGTVLQAQTLQSGDSFSIGGQTGFSQCQTQTLSAPGPRGRPGGKAGPAAQQREISICSGFEVGYTAISGPFCSVTLTAITPAKESVPAADSQPPPPPQDETPAATPAGNPSLQWVVAEDGSDLHVLYGSSIDAINPIDMMEMREVYCWASSTPPFQGVRATATHTDFPEKSVIMAQLMGSTTLYEDDEGYMTCDDAQMRLIGSAEVQAVGSGTITLDVRTDGPMASWPCAMEVSAQVMQGEADLVEQILDIEPLESWVSCPE